MLMRLRLIPNHFRRRGVRTGGYSQAKNEAWMHGDVNFSWRPTAKSLATYTVHLLRRNIVQYFLRSSVVVCGDDTATTSFLVVMIRPSLWCEIMYNRVAKYIVEPTIKKFYTRKFTQVKTTVTFYHPKPISEQSEQLFREFTKTMDRIIKSKKLSWVV